MLSALALYVLPVYGREMLNARSVRLIGLRLLARLARRFVRRTTTTPARILYIKPDHLGDLLLATPVLAALRQRFPTAQITGLIGPWSRPILEHNPAIDTLLICPFPGFMRAPKDTKRGTQDAETFWRSRSALGARRSALIRPYLMLLRFALLLRAGRYDLAIIGRDDHWWGAALALLAGIPQRVGFAVPECSPFLSVALPWDPAQHVTAQGLALVEAAAPTREPIAGDLLARFDPLPADMSWAHAWLQAQGVGVDEALIAIHPGTGGPAKLWFADRWAAVADALQTLGARVLLTGGPGEEALVAEVASCMRATPLALVGQTTIGQLAALFRQTALVLGVDSGPLHLAAAQGCPTLHLYGPGDAGRFGPWGDPARHVVIRVELWCSPCGVFDACPRGLARPECMEQIGVAEVISQARRLLERA
jgi:ADP-heptose:LPS heptosyltransferase